MNTHEVTVLLFQCLTQVDRGIVTGMVYGKSPEDGEFVIIVTITGKRFKILIKEIEPKDL